MAYENKGALAATIVVAASNSLNRGAANYVCDGTDDQVEIQEAIDAAAGAPYLGGVVQLSEGLFYISDTIHMRDYVSLIGCPGLLVTTIFLVNNSDCHMIEFETTAIQGRFHIRHMRLDGNKANQASGHGIYFHGTDQIQDIILDDVLIVRTKQHGFYSTQALWGGKVYDVLAEYCDEDGFHFKPSQTHVAHCFSELNGGFGFYIIAGANLTVLGCNAISCDHAGFYLNTVHEVRLYSCLVNSCGSNVNESLDSAISLPSVTNGTIVGCVILDGGTHSYNGINIGSASSDITIVGNVIEHPAHCGIRDAPTTARVLCKGNIFKSCAPAIQGPGGIMHESYADIFRDVLAVTANHVVNAQALNADPITINPANANQPDYPRTLSYTITSGTITEFDLSITGRNAKGQTVTETFDETGGLTGETSNAFATVTEVKIENMVGELVADTLDVGITDVLGLSNVIYADADIYKITKNNVNETIAAAQIDLTYDTYDMAVIVLALNDDFIIWYRSNLNIIA